MPDAPGDQHFLDDAEDTLQRLDAVERSGTAHAPADPGSLEEEVARIRALDSALRRQHAPPATAGAMVADSLLEEERRAERGAGAAAALEGVAEAAVEGVRLDDADAARLELQRRQDRQVMAAALREQENLARMEELQSQQEFEEFLEQIRHEKHLGAAIRQDEVERLWAQLQLRREEEHHHLRVLQLSNLRETARLQAEIEEVRTRVVELRARRHALEGPESSREARAVGRLLTRSPSENAADALLDASMDHDALDATEARLIARMEERLESLVASMDTARANEFATPAFALGLPSVESVPRPRFAPERLLLAGKGLFLVEPFPIRGTARPRRFAPDYDASTRALALGERGDGTPRIFVSHRGGVGEVCPDAERVVASWPLDNGGRYAANGIAPLEDGALLATHSELGLLRWEEPGADPVAPPGWSGGSARALAPTPTGFVFAAGGTLWRTDLLATRVEPLVDLGAATTITDVASAADHLLVGTAEGQVVHLALGAPERRPQPLLPGAKVYSLALVAWRGEVWVAAGVRKRTGLYVVLHALGGRAPELTLSVPERPYRLAMPADGQLLALGDRYLCAWDLDVSQQATVTPLGAIAPLQDFALLPGL